MTDYFFCCNCDHMYENSERAHEYEQAICKHCIDWDPEFYSSNGGLK